MKRINKYSIIIVLTLTFVLIFSLFSNVKAAGKASFVWEKGSITSYKGGIFTTNVWIYPNGETLDVARLFMNFSPSTLTVQNFALSSAFPNQSPASSINNDTGSLNEGGYINPTGSKVTSNVVYGTITFYAKEVGTGTAVIAANSRLISNGEEVNSGATSTLTVTIKATAEKKPTEEVTPTTPEEIPEEVTPTTPEEEKVFPPSTTSPITINCTVEQDKWSSKASVNCSWNPLSDVKQYYYVLNDQIPNNKSLEPIGNQTSLNLDDLSDGIWYLYVSAEKNDGSFIEQQVYRLQIDITPPNEILPSVEFKQIQSGEKTDVYFLTTDNTSGIDHYEVSINDGEFSIQTSPLSLAGGKEPGTYKITVKAVDKAGNYVIGTTSVDVVQAGAQVEKKEVSKEAVSKGGITTKEELIKFLKENAVILSVISIAIILIIIILILKVREKKDEEE